MPRPYVICHMCTTIDGKVLSHRWPKLPAGRGAASLFETTAATFGIPAWLVGTTTMKEIMGQNLRLPKAKGPVPAGDFVANAKPKGLAIGTDAKSVLRFQENEVDGDHVVLLLTGRASRDYRAALREAGVSYLICGGGKQVDLRVALEKLGRLFKLKKLMLQGGGTFNGAMLAAGLVDEISQVIVPIVDGGGPGVTGVFDAPQEEAPSKGMPLNVISHKTLPGGVHWLRYRVGGGRR
jgi:2,5-diamino-6-(ribosylamino)-4(3H)-pyrimidinone 5'-phosphate reductase